jgi:hypothetical protein
MGCALWAADASSNATATSVSAGQRLCGAPRRNRTGDPILTMEPPGTAVRTAVFAGHARPLGPKLSALSTRSYAFSCIPGSAEHVIEAGRAVCTAQRICLLSRCAIMPMPSCPLCDRGPLGSVPRSRERNAKMRSAPPLVMWGAGLAASRGARGSRRRRWCSGRPGRCHPGPRRTWWFRGCGPGLRGCWR